MADVLSKLQVIISANTAQMNAQLNKANKSLGVLSSSVQSLQGYLVGTFGAYQIINGIKRSIAIIADFEKQMDKVRAITGATGKEFEALQQNALDLGRSTEYTARQIAGLQVEYGRLGFSTKEILNSTKATLNLATATGEDLARSAEIAGSTLRAFRLDAAEMGRVTDVITGALNQSALALDSFADGMKYVAPVAEATNVSIEETSALLSVLADAGIKGSQAGTSLRRIMTLLDKSGKPLNERLQELAASGITLADANDEVGLYAQTALLVIAKQLDKVNELTEGFENLNGETQRTADIMRDNLSGDADKFTSALEGLILEGSAFNDIMRSIVQSGTNIINFFAGVTDAVHEFDGALHAFRTNGSFRDRVFGRDFQGDIAALRKLREEAGLLSSGANAPNPTTNQIAGADFFAQKAVEEADARRAAAQEAERLLEARRKQFELERKLYNLQLEALKESDLPDIDTEGAKNRFGSSFLSGDLGGLLEEDTLRTLAELGQQYEQEFDRIVETTEEMTAAQEADTIATRKREQAYIRMASAASDAIAAGIAGEKTFAQVLAGTTASVIDSLERQALAAIIAKSALSGKNPIAAILGATAGFAIIKGLFAKISRGSSSGRVGGESVSRLESLTPAQRGITVNVEGRVSGRDIEFSQVENDRVTQRVKANG